MRRFAVLAALLVRASVAYAGDKPSAGPAFSGYEQQTMDRVLAARRATVDPEAEGKWIEDVDIEVLEVIEDRDPLPAVLNRLHQTTRDRAVRREVLFRRGQRFERALADETERNLRLLRQHSLVVVLPLRGASPDRVRVLVLVKDVWSLRLNSAFRITGQGVEQLLLQPSEENLLGMRRSLSGTVAYDPVTVSVGGAYVEPRLSDSRVRLGLAVNGIVNHRTGQAEGTFGSFEYGVPIYFTRQDWAWGTTVAWREGVTRRFRGTTVNVFNADGTDSCTRPSRCIPIEYRSDLIAGTVGVARSFGRERIQIVEVGAAADRRAYRVGDLSAYDPDAVERFVEEQVPTSVTRNGPFARYHFYENRWTKLQEVESLGLQENYRLGVEVHARVYPLLSAFGSSRTLLGYTGAVSYTHAVPDGLLRGYAMAGIELSPSHDAVANATVQGGLRVVTPRFGVGRLVSDSTFTLRPYNTLNTLSTLGGDGRLRGYLSGLILGENLFATNLEFRSRALQLWTFQVGGAVFYDVGDAFDSVRNLRPKQAAGLGLRLGFPQLDRVVMRVDLGIPLTTGVHRHSVLDGLVVTFDQAFEMPQVTSSGVVR